jgi:hypothetical protein
MTTLLLWASASDVKPARAEAVVGAPSESAFSGKSVTAPPAPPLVPGPVPPIRKPKGTPSGGIPLNPLSLVAWSPKKLPLSVLPTMVLSPDIPSEERETFRRNFTAHGLRVVVSRSRLDIDPNVDGKPAHFVMAPTSEHRSLVLHGYVPFMVAAEYPSETVQLPPGQGLLGNTPPIRAPHPEACALVLQQKGGSHPTTLYAPSNFLRPNVGVAVAAAEQILKPSGNSGSPIQQMPTMNIPFALRDNENAAAILHPKQLDAFQAIYGPWFLEALLETYTLREFVGTNATLIVYTKDLNSPIARQIADNLYFNPLAQFHVAASGHLWHPIREEPEFRLWALGFPTSSEFDALTRFPVVETVGHPLCRLPFEK